MSAVTVAPVAMRGARPKTIDGKSYGGEPAAAVRETVCISTARVTVGPRLPDIKQR
jgi:hypothetical protein